MTPVGSPTSEPLDDSSAVSEDLCASDDALLDRILDWGPALRVRARKIAPLRAARPIPRPR